MDQHCRYCQATVSYEELICPQCGSRLVDMEERKRRWPLIAGIVAVLAAGAGVFMFANYSSEVANTPPPPENPKKEATAAQKAQEDERSRQAVVELDRKWQEELDREAAAAKEQKAWDTMTAPQRSAHVAQQLDVLKKEVDQLRAKADPKGIEALTEIDTQWAHASEFLKAGSIDVAYESFKVLRDQVRALSQLQPQQPRVQ